MDELIVNIQQRKGAIESMKQLGKLRHKSEVFEEERKRSQRENWILKVLKTLKRLSPQQKKTIHEAVIKIMGFYSNVRMEYAAFEYTTYTESFISLFVEFYNSLEQADPSSIKIIIRPNNSYIIVDLIGSLIDLSRKEFQLALQEAYRESPHIKPKKKKSVSNYLQTHLKSENVEYEAKEVKEAITLQDKIGVALYEKYLKFVEGFSESESQERLNDIYCDLLYSNQRNAAMIQKYATVCYGQKRHINYNISGLYTHEEMREMMKDSREQSLLRMTDLKELKGPCTTKQLRENFKMKIQIHESSKAIPVITKIRRLASWLPLVVLTTGDRCRYLVIAVQNSGTAYSSNDLEQRLGKRLRVYLRDELQDTKKELANMKRDFEGECSSFNRKEYLDQNNSKVMDILNKESFVKKEALFPMLKAPDCREDEKSFLKMKMIKSEMRLPSKQWSLVALNHRENSEMERKKESNKCICYSNFIREMGNGSNDRINSLIETILKSRQYSPS